MATTTTTTRQPDWMARSAKRRHLELGMLQQSSETSIDNQTPRAHSTSNSTTSDHFPHPSSPASSSVYSTAGSSMSITFTDERHEKLQALQKQYALNAAQVQANETRLREIRIEDDRMSERLQSKLSAVTEVNKQLNALRTLLGRLDAVMQAWRLTGFALRDTPRRFVFLAFDFGDSSRCWRLTAFGVCHLHPSFFLTLHIPPNS
ncbi:unnamed protein product [Zymoseptoria tritici ST99CH_1E4]|uniref:Uncharacterized protein n=1 Tax=Zymoseptoria tritici ST99CH_1E4 TaxID=1276532 RepID=A0A2H1G693_ZYMTR|nr:unnamed protein product [Zymoseptoria tritici ST99CH_1E4]